MASVAAAAATGIASISPSGSLDSSRARKLAAAASQGGRGVGSKVFVLVPNSLGSEKRRRRVCVCAFRGATKSARPDPRPDSISVSFAGIDFYELLGISNQVTLPEIKVAYREKARRYHPDANPPSMKEECTKRFLQVQEAYEVLTDSERRADYDYRLANPLSLHALQSFSFMRRGKARGGSVVEDEVVDKGVWKSQWGSQLHGLNRKMGKQKAGSWAAELNKRRQEAVPVAA